jgi:hypothetical protein
MTKTSTDFFQLCIHKFKQIAPKDIHELFSEIAHPSKANGDAIDMHKMQFSAFLIASTYLSSHKVVRRNKGKITPLNLFHIHTIPSGKGKSFCHDTFIKPLANEAGTFCKLQFAMQQSEIEKKDLINLERGRSRSLYFNSVTSAQLSQSAGLTPKGVLCSFPEYDEVLKKGKNNEHFNESQAIFTSAFVGDSVNQQAKGDISTGSDLVKKIPFVSGLFATQPNRQDGALDNILTIDNLQSGYVSRLTLISTSCPVKDLVYVDSDMRSIRPWETDNYANSVNNLDAFYEKILKSPAEIYQIDTPNFSDNSMVLFNDVRKYLFELWLTVELSRENKSTSFDSMMSYFELKVNKYVGLAQSLIDARDAASMPETFSSLTDEDLEKLIGAVTSLKEAKRGMHDTTKGIGNEMESYFPLFLHKAKPLANSEEIDMANKYLFSYEYYRKATNVSAEALEFGTLLACWSMMETLETIEKQVSLFTPDTDSIEDKVMNTVFRLIETYARSNGAAKSIPLNDYRNGLLDLMGYKTPTELIITEYASKLGKEYMDIKKDKSLYTRIKNKLAKQVNTKIEEVRKNS